MTEPLPEEVDPPDETTLDEFLSQIAADEGVTGLDDEDDEEGED